MSPLNRLTCAALVATAFALCLGCGGEEGPGYLKNPGDAPPLSAEQHSASASEAAAVADEESAEAANYLKPSKGKSKRGSSRHDRSLVWPDASPDASGPL